ncbi:hybrid sensor histidine kinase/response regulator [Puteibacter caeruleilacunae]|nr:hybrid sensor histidine kinase/response regulator [Puteibacter caeruleilacunae]
MKNRSIQLSIICIVLILLGLKSSASNVNLRFKNYNLQEGLSFYEINTIAQDSIGYLWIGTSSGLNRFDGYEFKTYSEPDFFHKNKNIQCLSTDKNFLWIGTKDGLFCMALETGKIFELNTFNGLFKSPSIKTIRVIDNETIFVAGKKTLVKLHYSFKDSRPVIVEMEDFFQKVPLLADKTIDHIELDNDRLWIGGDQFFGYVHLMKKEFQDLTAKIGKQVRITSLFKDSQNKLWVANSEIAFKINLNLSHLPVRSFHINPGKNPFESYITTITEDRNKNIWIGTFQRGVFIIPINDKRSSRQLKYESDNVNSLADNDIRSIFVDQSGTAWVGTYGNGLDKVDVVPNYFNFYLTQENVTNWIGPHGVSSICNQDKNYFWASSGSSGGGVFRFNKHTKEVKYIYPPDQKPELFTTQYLSITDSTLWIAPYNDYILSFDLEKQKFERHSLLESALNKPVRFIIKDKKSYWIAFINDGLYQLFDKVDDGKPYLLKHLNYKPVNKVFLRDSKGKFWLPSTGGGIIKYNPRKQTQEKYKYNPNDPNSLTSNYVTSIAEDNKENIWVATNNGLNQLNPHTGKIKHYREKEGLSHTIYSVLTDNNGFVWVATKNMINRLDPATGAIKRFGKEYGIENCKFNFHSCMKSQDGNFYFGTENKGIVQFNPTQIPITRKANDVIISNISILNQSVKVSTDTDSHLSKDIAYTKALNLKHFENSFSLEFISLFYHLQDRITYQYQLEGFDNNWRKASKNNRRVNYSNLSPGQYTFKVRALNQDGIVSEKITTLAIHIHSPWWATLWAYAGYLIVFIGILSLIWFYSIRQVRLKAQLRLERSKREQETELNNMKLRFFTNISHEFRTPLTLLLGQLDLLQANGVLNEEDRQRKYQVMHRNGHRLLRLINQLLDFRKVENRTLQVKAQECHLIRLLAEIIIPFEEMAGQKEIDFKFQSSIDSLQGYTDVDKLEKIIQNLLGNALKFTDAGGSIKVIVDGNTTHLNITICDTGIGIAPEHQDKIFERFYQVEKGLNYEGSGIGLAYTKDLINLLHGSISLDSEENKGSCFTIQLPILKESFSDDELVVVQKEVTKSSHVTLSPSTLSIDNEDGDKPLILIIDDEKDVRELIAESIGNNFNYIFAGEGESALQVLKEHAPELIVCDVMMPVMDGHQFTKALKEDINISHIPVILLTAQTSDQQRLDGIATGADSFITKPFSPAYLKTRVVKLIENRQTIRKKFAQSIDSIVPETEDLPNPEKDFIDKVIAIIEENMSNPDFRIEHIYTEVGMSRTHFFNKIKALTDHTANEFIRTIKMKKAAKLIKEGHMRINEIAWAVGFADPKYFSKVFKSYHGVSPSDFK